MKRSTEANNIEPVRQDDTPPKLSNDDKQPTSSKSHNPTKKPKYEIRQLIATLQLNRKDKMLYVPLQFHEYENFGLLDTGAIQSALSEAELRRVLSAHPAALLQELPAPEFKVQIANGSIVPVRKQVLLRKNIHGSPNHGKCTHRNVILQEVLSNPGLSQQHSEISPPTTLSQREIQK